MNTYFPPELVDYVIEHLWDDKAALRTCALVCRMWAPGSRYHLFREFKVCIRSIADLDALIGRIPHIGRLVEHFSLTILLEWYGCLGSRTNDIPSLLATSMPHVQDIRMRFTRMKPLFQERLLVGAVQFCSVKTLDVFHCDIPTYQTFYELMHAFPSLSVLKLRHIRWDETDVGSATLECVFFHAPLLGLRYTFICR